jgi:type I restriction enzyme S subunit
MSWPLVKFKDIADVVTGATPKKNTEYFDGEVPFVTPGDLGVVSEITTTSRTLSSEGAATVRSIPAGSVMVCCIGATIGKVGYVNQTVATNQQINSLVVDILKAVPKYVYYYCLTLKPKLISASSSTTIPIVNKSTFAEFEIPLPPLAEQKRIASILDKADAIRQKRKQAIDLADEFLRSVFLDMFGDPVTNPKGWEVRVIGDFLKIKHGYAFKSEYFVEKSEYELLTPGSFYEAGGYRDRGDKKKFYSGPIDKEYVLSKGDLLVAMTEQAPGLLGSCLRVPNKNILHNQRLGLLQFNNEIVNCAFVYALFNNSSVRKQIQSSSTGTKVKHTSPTKLESIEIGLPPIHMQSQFMDLVVKVNENSTLLQRHNELAPSLFESLSQKAFSGEL